jgi:hypothetical protein
MREKSNYIGWGLLPFLLAVLCLHAGTGHAASIHVPADYPTIQGAIDAAGVGDTVLFGPGRFNETLIIAKSITLAGSGTSNCVLYALTNVPLVSITGPGTVVLSNFEIEGGQYMGPDWYSGFSPRGIVATNADLILDTIVMNQVNNYFVTAINCQLLATDVGLWTRDVLGGCDIGFQLKGCTGTIRNLRQDAGHLDHTININDPPASHSDITISNCSIRASGLSYGNCIRTYTDSVVRINGCYMYRNPNDPVPAFPAFNHNGVSISGYSNQVTITDNVFTNLPWSIYCVGSLGGNRVLVQSNIMANCLIGGIVWDSMSYEGIDLGGGRLGSKGGNVFGQFTALPNHYCADILTTNLNGRCSANIYALNNTWSNPTNRESLIIDKLDNPVLGRVVTDSLFIKSLRKDPSGRDVLTWNERGAGEKYTVNYSTNLQTGLWFKAPGFWPITNSSPQNDFSWTNPISNGTTVFYRIRSYVP